MNLKSSLARECPLAADTSIAQEPSPFSALTETSDGGLQMGAHLRSQVPLATDAVTNQDFSFSIRDSLTQTQTQHLRHRLKNAPLCSIIPNVRQRSAIGSVLKQIQMKAETMLIQAAAAAAPTSSSPASLPSVVIHVKWLHTVTFCFSCQHFCCSQENLGSSF